MEPGPTTLAPRDVPAVGDRWESLSDMFRLARFSALNITCSKHTYFSESSRIAKSPQLRGLGAKEPRRFCSGESVRQERLCRSQQCLRLLPHKLFPRAAIAMKIGRSGQRLPPGSGGLILGCRILASVCNGGG